jgi:hypothetical protein
MPGSVQEPESVFNRINSSLITLYLGCASVEQVTSEAILRKGLLRILQKLYVVLSTDPPSSTNVEALVLQLFGCKLLRGMINIL